MCVRTLQLRAIIGIVKNVTCPQLHCHSHHTWDTKNYSNWDADRGGALIGFETREAITKRVRNIERRPLK